MPKKVQTTAQLPLSHMLEKWCSQFSKSGFNSMWTKNFQMFKLDSEKAEELHKEDLNDVITHLEPDILEFEVKRALGSITMNKASGGDGIPVELFQVLKDDAV